MADDPFAFVSKKYFPESEPSEEETQAQPLQEPRPSRTPDVVPFPTPTPDPKQNFVVNEDIERRYNEMSPSQKTFLREQSPDHPIFGKPNPDAIQQSNYLSAEMDPDRQAQVLQIANEYGVSPDLAARNFDTLTKKYIVEKPNYDRIVAESPGLAKWLETPEHAALARNDMERLAKASNAIKSLDEQWGRWKTWGMKFLSGMYQVASWDAEWKFQRGRITPEDYVERQVYFKGKMAQWDRSMPNWYKKKDQIANLHRGDIDKVYEKIVRDTPNKLWAGDIVGALKDYAVGIEYEAPVEILSYLGFLALNPDYFIAGQAEQAPYSLPALAVGGIGGKGAQMATRFVAKRYGLQALGKGITQKAAAAGLGTGAGIGTMVVEVPASIQEDKAKAGFDLSTPEGALGSISDPVRNKEWYDHAIR